jgi:hypothetical protein
LVLHKQNALIGELIYIPNLGKDLYPENGKGSLDYIPELVYQRREITHEDWNCPYSIGDVDGVRNGGEGVRLSWF